MGRAKIRKKGGLSEKDIQKVGKSSICCQFLSSEHVNTYARVGEAFINCMTLCHLEEGEKLPGLFGQILNQRYWEGKAHAMNYML